MLLIRSTIFLFFVFLISCEKRDENFFPFKEGKIWDYLINMGSSYTGKNIEKRILITNIRTKRSKSGYEITRLHSNGNSFKYFLNNKENNVTRISAILKNNEGLIEPVKKEIYPDLSFNTKEWILTEQLFLTKGNQPPLDNFRPETNFEMKYNIEENLKKFNHRGKTYFNCYYVIGQGYTSFIADTRSGPLDVEIISEEWICDGVGVVREKRSEITNASAFGKVSFTKELIFHK